MIHCITLLSYRRTYCNGQSSGRCDKCTVLTVTLKQHPFCADYFYIINAQDQFPHAAKYLGVLIDSKLTFNGQLDYACKKANTVLAFVRRNFVSCQHKIRHLSYVASYVKQYWNMRFQSVLLIPSNLSINWNLFRDALLGLSRVISDVQVV